MKTALYANSQEAEAAFYDALSKNDLDAMMAVWADDDDIYCIHPGAPRIAGVQNVRESWRRIFTGGQSLSFQLRARHELHGMMIAIHSVYEYISVAGQGASRTPMLATNIYLRTDHGWRMVAHHASPAPAAPAAQPSAENEARRGPKTLH
ncbi:MAG: nuclear transport factor 2 family protein [Betaproteobacteria bacterium]|nr:nuclear transport factor 2 family protein [Betaproteobacteria bacterium]